jgi:hypothetical protein
MTRARPLATLLCAGLGLFAAPAAAQEQPPASPTVPAEIKNEYRVTAFPNYPLTDKLTGIAYVGFVTKPDAEYRSAYLGSGFFYRSHKHVELAAMLISVWTDQYAPDTSDTLELRPFTGVKFMGSNAKRWTYYNWTRYEMRFTEDSNSGDWTLVHRIRNQTRINFPLTSLAKAWTPKTFFAWTDIEPIWRSDTGEIDPLRWRTGIGYIAHPRLIVEFQYYAQYTRPESGLKYTDNLIRLNFKWMTKRGLLPQYAIRRLLDGDIDDD